MARFGRVYSLVAGPGGGTGIEVANGTGQDSLKIAFEISKTDDRNPNRSIVRLWNLKPENRELLERKDTRCVLKAGYAEEGGPVSLFEGDVVFAWSRFEPPNVVTTLELGEGAKSIRDSMVSLGYPPGVSSGQAVRDIAARMGLALHMPDDAPERTWANGLSFHGPARVALDKVAQGAGLSWSVQNGLLQVIRAGGTTNRTVFELAADTGLLTAPERERAGAREAAAEVTDQATQRRRRVASATAEVDGWRVRSLVLPGLVPGDRVKLASRSVQGVFAVKELRHVGDSAGGEWATELKLIDPKAATTDRRAQTPPGRTRVRQTPAAPLPLPPPPAPIRGGIGGAGL